MDDRQSRKLRQLQAEMIALANDREKATSADACRAIDAQSLVQAKGYGLGLISLSQGFVQPAYPASLRLSDILMVSVTVLFIGGLAGLIPANKARKVSAKFSEL